MNYSLCLFSVTQSLFIFVEIFETCTDYNFKLNFALQNKKVWQIRFLKLILNIKFAVQKCNKKILTNFTLPGVLSIENQLINAFAVNKKADLTQNCT